MPAVTRISESAAVSQNSPVTTRPASADKTDVGEGNNSSLFTRKEISIHTASQKAVTPKAEAILIKKLFAFIPISFRKNF
jgi:hypothetical protein